MYQVLVPATIDKSILEFLLDFALTKYQDRKLFRANGYSRQFCKLNDHQQLFNFDIDDLMRTTFTSIGLYKTKIEPMFGVFIGVNTEGGNVHRHRDPSEEGYIHTRLNFLLSKPIDGGVPVINGEKYPMEEGDCWINLASEWDHESTPVVGNKHRVVLSVGALVDEEELRDKFLDLFKI